MKRLWVHAGHHWKKFGFGCSMLLLTNAAALGLPQLTRLTIDAITEGESVDYIKRLALGMVAVAVAGALFRTLSRVNIFFAARDVELELRTSFYEYLTRLEPAYFQGQSTGDLMSRATNDLTQIRLLLGPGLLNVVNTSIAYVSAVPLMLMISPKLTLIIFSIYPLALGVMRYLSRQLYRRNRVHQAAMGDMSALVQESLAGGHVIRTFGLEGERQRAYEVVNEQYYEAGIHLAWIRSGMFRVVMTIASLSTLLCVYFGARDVLAEELTIGEVVAMVEYMALLAWPTFALGWVLAIVQRGRAAMVRMEEVMDYAPRIVPGLTEASTLAPSLSVKSLCVDYGAGEILRDLSFDVKSGETLGIVGEIGSGKTTLLRACMRLLEVSSGRIELGGVEVGELDRTSLRGMFGYVAQETMLFSNSLEKNIAFGTPDIGSDAVVAAMKAASFSPDDPSLPNGLATMVGERGITLSGGQKQRASIARALLVDPPILVLDDSLSAVDSDTETTIIDNLRRLRKGKTTLIVAHRLSAVSHADHILVLEGGAIVERGRPTTLAKAGGVYQRMMQLQDLERELNA